ncbi:MAG: hypothetical protein AVDCRST_MAG12-2798 [uncultured Rubrobacteraceae bacterium]|uniref:Uncharacterized protein n=1 Tax=uncultured Rubrobacteraceae bacterium TaxID=349277 RepID=A0A6J4SRK4_9ACTN|nr:MAG: hypothetical protein AVDCRST_MAG12-2798 [uncultured Rubrobacteraceae bacterium]
MSASFAGSPVGRRSRFGEAAAGVCITHQATYPGCRQAEMLTG